MQKLYYSPGTGGFYDIDINTNLFVEHVDTDSGAITYTPDQSGPIADAIAITDAEHAALLAAQAEGHSIQAGEGGAPVAVAPTFDQIKASLCAQIDSSADAAYNAIGGNSPGRLAEYQQAKDDATAFKNTGYTGEAPPTVACWAQAKGWTAQQACDDILTTAAAWGQALVLIRTTRLIGKGNVSTAADAAGAQAAADSAIATIRAVPAAL